MSRFSEEVAAAKQQSHWSGKQRNHMRRLIKQEATIGYWCSDARGRPANHEMGVMLARAWTARPGLVQEVAGPLEPCSGRALHATLSPHIWRGSRVWVVGLVGDVAKQSDKFAALRREIVGEVLPEEALSPQVGIRIGRRDLSWADLSRAYLSGADLSGANLSRAYLSRANLSGADLSGANLSGADLSGANLSRAYLSGADLSGADLSGADLSRANLSWANLSRAYLSGADLSRAYLSGANLSGADLTGANLTGAELWKTVTPPVGWIHGETADCGCCSLLRRAA